MSMSTLGTKGLSLNQGSVGTLREWQGLYEVEKANYDSAALYAEVSMCVSIDVSRDELFLLCIRGSCGRPAAIW
jgi:hypothetical protein